MKLKLWLQIILTGLVVSAAAMTASANETDRPIPDFTLDEAAEAIDPTFGNDVAVLAPNYGGRASVMIYGVPDRETFEPALKLLFPENLDKRHIYRMRAIVELPLLCTVAEEFICNENSPPRGVFQLTHIAKGHGYEALIRFPTAQRITVRLKTMFKSSHSIRLWIIRDGNKLLKQIDLKDVGTTESRAIPILRGVSDDTLPEAEVKRLKRFDIATPVEIFDKNGSLLVSLLMAGDKTVGYGKISADLCNRFPALGICTQKTRLGYVWTTIKHEYEVVATHVRIGITLRKPGTSEKVTVVFYKSGLEPHVRFEAPELEGFLYISDMEKSENQRVAGKIFGVRAIFGDQVKGLQEQEIILGYRLER
ncbi:MAG: hypothetical protein ABJN26_25230 [Stappiaceae bacterium]